MKKIKTPLIVFSFISLLWITVFFISKTFFSENNFTTSSKEIYDMVKSNNKTSAQARSDNESSIEIADLQKITGEIVTKSYDGSYMSPLITASELKTSFYFEFNGVSEESNLVLNNPNTGENFEMYLNENGKYTVDENLEENTTYAILLNNSLTGALTIVPSLDDVYDASLYMEVMQLLQCGL